MNVGTNSRMDEPIRTSTRVGKQPCIDSNLNTRETSRCANWAYPSESSSSIYSAPLGFNNKLSEAAYFSLLLNAMRKKMVENRLRPKYRLYREDRGSIATG
ncbi:MAG: hypothetical protein VYA34_03445 [Myxococcota bacterium]|nr:hypothetical protein [Myxococcota bacterium]